MNGAELVAAIQAVPDWEARTFWLEITPWANSEVTGIRIDPDDGSAVIGGGDD